MIAEVASLTSSIGGQRGVIATTDIETGSLIVLEWPFLTWNEFDFSDNSVLLRMVEQIVHDPKAYECSKDLHPTSLSNLDSKEIENIQLQFQQINLLEHATSLQVLTEEIYRLLLVIKHNAFSSGLYHQLCMINHSCQPNCIKFEPRSASRGASEVWSVRPIRKGEEITISYVTPIEEINPTMRDYLFQQHYFHCECQRCQQFQFFSQQLPSPLASLEMPYSDSIIQLGKDIEGNENDLQEFLQEQSSSSFVVSSEEDEQLAKYILSFDQLLSRLDTIKLAVLYALNQTKSETTNNRVKLDNNLYRLEARILTLTAQLHLFKIEAILIPHYQSSGKKALKGQLTAEHELIFSSYLSVILRIFLAQIQYYESEDHPLIATNLTDYQIAIDYLDYFCTNDFIRDIIVKTVNQLIKEREEEILIIPSIFQLAEGIKLTDINKSIKKELNRCRGLYLLASRCRSAIFVKKEVGASFWGQK